ncbi:hypothetical protein RIF29_39190 [Crotalaria pallida]|uniref:Uncharacterized protein n=1 Tax=Crotalaria pallida TaxID=3830 RepID=A0AAN9E0N1_CROPI
MNLGYFGGEEKLAACCPYQGNSKRTGDVGILICRYLGLDKEWLKEALSNRSRRKDVALNTYWDATKVMVNPPLDEVQTFRQIFKIQLRESSSDKFFSPIEQDHSNVLPIESQNESNTAVREAEFDDFITPDNSSKRKALTLSSQELDDIVGLAEFQTPQLSSSKGSVHIKSEIDKN